jgi:thiamine kinase-like enzyme
VEALLERVKEHLGPLEGEPVALTGGITNRNYRWGDYVVRVPGPKTELLGIDRGAEVAAARLAAKLGIGAEVVMDEPLVTRFIEGRVMESGELRERLGEVARALRALHDSGADLPVRFDAVSIVKQYANTARAHDVELPAGFEGALRSLHARVRDYRPVPCHNDLLPSNFIEDDQGRLRIVDWEYAGMGDRRFDLGNFAVNNGVEDDEALLVAYGSGGSLEVQRFASDFFEAMWAFVQSGVSDLDFDYAAYARERFDRLAR